MSGPGMAKLPNGQTTIKSFGALLAKAKDINDADVAAEAKESVKIKKDKAEAKPKKKDDKSTKAAKPTKVFKVKKEAKAKVKAKASKTAAKAKAKSAAKVKKEKGIKVKSAATAKAKAKAKATAKAKAKPQAKAKSKQPKSNWIKRRREKVAEKSEKQKKEKKESKSEKAGSEKPCKLEGESGLDWGKKFYKNQVGFINQVVDGEWTISFGALGTGLVGVRMRSKAPVAPAMAPPVVPPSADAEAPVAEAPAAEAPVEGDAEAPAAGVAGAEGAVEAPVEAPVEAKARRVKLQKEDLLVLFRNAPACGAQTRGSKTLAGYSGGALDVDEFTLEWSSQRSDMENKVIDQVVDHIGSGGVTMVAVKPPSSAENIAYRLLGQVSKVDNIKLAQRLCEPGERVICEEGSGKVHLAMTPNCFGDNKALLDSTAWGSGPLLSVKRYSEDDGRLCKHCCFRTPSATLHFEHLEPAGVEAYTRARGQRRVKEEKEEKEDPEEQEEQAAPPRPKRRMRCKKPLEAEEAPVEADVDVDATPEGPAPDPREELKEWPEFVSIKLEPTDR